MEKLPETKNTNKTAKYVFPLSEACGCPKSRSLGKLYITGVEAMYVCTCTLRQVHGHWVVEFFFFFFFFLSDHSIRARRPGGESRKRGGKKDTKQQEKQ